MLEANWKLHEIDGMDMLGYLKLRAWKANRKEKDEPQKTAPRKKIDEVWPMGGF